MEMTKGSRVLVAGDMLRKEPRGVRLGQFCGGKLGEGYIPWWDSGLHLLHTKGSGRSLSVGGVSR